MKICKVDNCNRSSYYKDNGRLGFCIRHYKQFHRYGKIFDRTYRDKNEYIDCGDYYEIILYNSNRFNPVEIARTKIDKSDFEKVKHLKWCLCGFNKKYVGSIIQNKSILLHCFLLNKVNNDLDIDHINSDKLDNRKINLRFVTRSQNMMNVHNCASKHRGVYWSKSHNKWIAEIMINYRKKYLGVYIDLKDAIKARKLAEEKYFGEFACKN